MAEDAFTAYFPNVTFAVNRAMFGISACSPNEIIRVYRIGVSNLSLTAVTGTLTRLDLNLYKNSNYTGAIIPVTPVAHLKSTVELESAVCFYNGEIQVGSNGVTGTIRRIAWSTDEANVGLATSDELQAMTEPNIIWQGGLADTAIQPLTLRVGEVLALVNSTAVTGLLNSWVEFTREVI